MHHCGKCERFNWWSVNSPDLVGKTTVKHVNGHVSIQFCFVAVVPLICTCPLIRVCVCLLSPLPIGTYLKAHPSHRYCWIMKCGRLRRSKTVSTLYSSYGGMGFVKPSFACACTITHILASAVGRIISTRLKIKKFLGPYLASSFGAHFCFAMLPMVSNNILTLMWCPVSSFLLQQPRFNAVAKRRLRHNRA